MKVIVVSIIAVTLIFTIYSVTNMEFSQVYQAEVKETVIDNTPEWAKDEDARKAAEAVIRRKELEAELEVVNTDIATLEARQAEIENELGF